MITLIPDFSDVIRPLALDETLNLARVFMANGQAFTVASTAMQPHWRGQLHDAGLFESPRWNAFDAIQDVQEVDGIPLTMNQLGMPTALNVTYLPNQASFFDGMTLYATVALTEAGYVDTVTFPEQDGVVQVDQYDDRGFRTWRTWRRNGKLIRRSWYTADGRLVMTQQADDHVEIATGEQGRFMQAVYPDMRHLVAEIVDRAIAQGTLAQPIIATASAELADLRALLQAPTSLKLLAAPDNPRLGVLKAHLAQFAASDELIVPTVADEERVTNLIKQLHLTGTPQLRYIPTYATTLSLGISNELSMQMIAWNVGDLDQDTLRAMYKAQLSQLRQHDDRSMTIVVANEDQQAWLNEQTAAWAHKALQVDMTSDDYQKAAEYRHALATHTLMVDMAQAMQPLVASDKWPGLMAAMDFLDRVQILPAMSPDDWQGLMQTARIYVDTGSRPVLALQVAAVSAGVPQIIMTPSDLVIAGGNGRVVANQGELTTAITYYLATLAHWNEALVVSADQIEKYAAPNIMAAWQEVIGDGKAVR